MEKAKKNISDISITIVLFLLIIIRICQPEKNHEWINSINFAGLIIACLTLYFDIFQESHKLKKISLFVGIFICILSVLIISEVLLVLDIIKLSPVANDTITLITLLISLPSQLHKRIISNIFK